MIVKPGQGRVGDRLDVPETVPTAADWYARSNRLLPVGCWCPPGGNRWVSAGHAQSTGLVVNRDRKGTDLQPAAPPGQPGVILTVTSGDGPVLATAGGGG